MNIDRTRIREGMTVFSSDGEKLGKVLSCDASMFVIEKGFFFPKDYIARYDDVTSIQGDDIHLALSKETFQDLRDTSKTTSDEGWRAGPFTTEGKPDTTTADVIGADYGLGSAGLGQPGMSDDLSKSARREATADDVRVPVAEEELDVVKRDRQAGEVRLKKDVVTETKHIDVPVTRKEVHVERVDASNRDVNATDSGQLFQKDSVSVPVHEEELEIHKRPVVKEEVRLRKERFTEQRAADADVRKERVDVEEEGNARRLDRDEDLSTRPMIPPRDDT